MATKYKLSVLGNVLISSVIATIILLLYLALPPAPDAINLLIALNFFAGILLVIVLVVGYFLDFNSCYPVVGKKHWCRVHWLWTGIVCGFPLVILPLLGLAWIGANWQEYLIEEVEES